MRKTAFQHRRLIRFLIICSIAVLLYSAIIFAPPEWLSLANAQTAKMIGGGTSYNVSGNIQANGGALADASVVLADLQGNALNIVTTNGSGDFSMFVIGEYSYSISVYKIGYNFDPSYQTLLHVQSDLTVNFQNGVKLCVPAPSGQSGGEYCQDGIPTNVSNIGNGRIAYEIFGNAFAVDADGDNQGQLPPAGSYPSWSPDGTRVLYNRDPSTDFGFDQEIFVMTADGLSFTQLTGNDWNDYRARFSPDGSLIIFDRMVHTGDWGVYTMNPDTSNQTRLTPIEVIATDASFSPDGTKIVYTDGFEIFVMDADGSNRTQLTNSGEFAVSIDPSWSPDGSHILFSSNRLEFGFEIWRMTAAGSSVIQLTSEIDLEHRSPVYSPDGTSIAYSRNTSANGYREIYKKQIFGGVAERLTFTFQQFNAESPSWQAIRDSVPVTVSGVKLTFSNVTTAGNTVLTPITLQSAGALPSGFQILSPPIAFDIRTSASFAGDIEICLNVPDVNDEDQFNGLAIFHNEDGVLIDRTSTRDFTARRICATVTSLSPFVVAAPAGPSAALVSVGGRVLNHMGTGAGGTVVSMRDASGAGRTSIASSLGHYRFDDVEVGQSYVFTLRSKRYQFATQVIAISESLSDFDFTPDL